MARTKVIGIDLGTTNSCVAVWIDGKAKVISNEYGLNTTPSCVSFDDGDILVGKDALDRIAMNPGNTIINFKRLIGRKFNDPEVQDDIKYWPFKVVGRDNVPMIQVEINGTFKEYYPEEISSMVLGKMRDIAENYLGEEVTDAVITVPAYFNNSQRQATKDAGTIAGLNVLRIISEPTAAALAYGIESRMDKERIILVYDLGGGTFDVSILSVRGNNFTVKATSGDSHLGGDDFDKNILKYCALIVKQRFHKDIFLYRRALSRLSKECERAKVKLSTIDNTHINVDYIFDQLDFETTITREKFEEINKDLFEKTLQTIMTALKDANLHKGDVDEVLMVGGSTRVPEVKRLVKEFFNDKIPNNFINPDEAVAIGAAIQANSLGKETCDKIIEVKVQDVTPLSLGVGLYNNIMGVVIPRNSPIPSKATRVFKSTHDYQKYFSVKICEGERPLYTDNNLIKSYNFTNLTLAKRGQLDYKTTLNLDADGILDVEILEDGTGKSNSSKINLNENKLSSDRIKTMVDEAKANKERDQESIARVLSLNALEDLTYKLRDIAESGVLSDVDSRILLLSVDAEIKWIDESRSVDKATYDNRNNNLKALSDPIVNGLNLDIEAISDQFERLLLN